MRKFIIANIYDFALYYTPFSHPLRFMSQMFYKINSVQYMKDHDIEIVPLIDFLDDINLKYELRDYNLCQKYINKENVNQIDNILKNFRSCINKLIEEIKTTNKYDNCIIYGIQPAGSDYFLNSNYDILKNKNIKVIMYCDDLHGYSMANNGLTTADINTQIDKNKLKFKDSRIDRCSYVLSHGASFFDYIDVYTEKTKLYFAPVDDINFSMYTPENFFQRENKILFSGAIGRYPLRRLLCSKICEGNPTALQYYKHMKHPGNNLSIDSCKTGGLYTYYIEISKYKGAIVGYHEKPLNYLLYKTFEILVCGTLLFSEEIDMMEQIGMKKFVHYVPISAENLCDAEYLAKYLNSQDGKQIAINGHKFVGEYLSIKKNLDFFIEMINGLNNSHPK